MKNSYSRYNIEEFLNDKLFIGWVLHGYNHKEWEIFVEDHPDIYPKIEKAREIIQLLRDQHEDLDEESVLKMWRNIEQFETNTKSSRKKIRIKKIFRWAALWLLLVSIGGLGYNYLKEKNTSFQFSSTELPTNEEDASLVLSDGQKIDLKKDKSTVELNSQDELVINSDSIINISSSSASDEVKMNEIVVPYGKSSEIVLSDGTKVWLNAGSRFAFPTKFTKKSREVVLVGEACFDVAENKEKPFVVSAGQINVQALGTYFNVSAYELDKAIETVLIEGSVAVKKKGSLGITTEEKILKPLQKASYDKFNKNVVVSEEPDALLAISWTEGLIRFSGEDLLNVFAKLERYYNVTFIMPEYFKYEELISGKLDLKDSLEGVLLTLVDVADIDFRISGDTVYIDRRMKEIKAR